MNVIFLDIDGVLQPFNNINRVNCNIEKVLEEVCNKTNDYSYYEMNSFEVAGVYLDWEKEAIDCLKSLIAQRNAKIVLSTGWRYMGYKTLVKLFKIHDLDKYIIGMTPYYETIENKEERYKEYMPKDVLNTFHHSRVIEILEYINNNDISNYVILDDINMTDDFKNHFIHVNSGYFNMEMLEKALEILDLKSKD